MAGSSLTVASVTNPYFDDSIQNTIVLDWLSDASDGSVSIDLVSTYTAAQATGEPQPTKLKGYIVGIETVPGKDGNLTDNLPTALYDITLDDPYGYDVAAAALADRSGTVAEKVVPTTPIPIDSEITVKIAAAGNSTKGRIILQIKPEV